MQHKTNKHNAGFTLVELLITIAILSILMMYAAPFFSEIIERKDMETAKNRIVHSLQKARKMANAENTFVDVNISENIIQLTPKNTSKSITIKIPGRITTESPVAFTFNSTGTLSNSDGQSIETIINITINPESNPSFLDTISISNTGIIASL